MSLFLYGLFLGIFGTLFVITGGFLVIEITAIRITNKIKEAQEDEK